jgi:hypothetical protein
MSNVIDTLQRTGTPPTVLGALQALDANLKRIEDARYRADAEREHIATAQAAAADQLQSYLAQDERAADAERDKALQELEAELAARKRIPGRALGDSDGQHLAQLARRQIEETQRLSALMLAVADVQAISIATDPADVAAAVEDVLATHAAPEAISRIGRAAEAKLRAMAAEESRKGELGAAFQALTLVGDKLRAWRDGIARESVEARRDRILSRHTVRTMNTRNSVLAAARLFNIESLVTRSATKAAIQSAVEARTEG